MIRNHTKDIILRVASKSSNAIVVNSYGRSGSTVLTKGLLNSSIRNLPFINRKVAKGSVSREAWDLNDIDLKKGAIYKTHDYPPVEVPKEEFKMLYTFGNPINVVLSIQRLRDEKGLSWIESHFDHLKTPYKNVDKIVDEDILNLHRHLNAWLKEKRFPVMFLNYETMWDYQDKISEYIGFNLRLPAFKQRKSSLDVESGRYIQLLKTYGSLMSDVSKLDNCFVINQ